jgi:2-phosphosulfolactate phosphatase
MVEYPPARSIQVHLTPETTHPHELAGQVVVVIDVLRATTTITAALAAGASRVIPCLEVTEARQLGRPWQSRGPMLLGGERQGRPIPGFDLGNSPAEYVPERVAGCTLIFTTTNGTRAIMRCIGASRVLLGGFVNLAALQTHLARLPRVELLCAGTDGQTSWEDTLLAGALLDRLEVKPAELNDAAILAWECWQQVGGRSLRGAQLAEVLSRGRGGRNLLEIQRADDIEWAARLDQLDVVPELDQSAWEIHPAQGDADRASDGTA